jgi:DNA adenine methylase
MVISPLRYPGGKSKLYPFFVALIKENAMCDVQYFEPYAGGAGLAIKLLINGFVEKISINDIDESIYAFWRAALYAADDFCDLIENTPLTIDEWHRQKSIWNLGDLTRETELGFSAYFLNRTNRSGIIEGAGPIGGYAQSGPWKIDVRLSKKPQIDNIKSLSRYAEQIDVSNLDAIKFIRKNVKKKNAFIYLDPPYFAKSRKLYKNFYEPSDHLQIAQELEKYRDAKWVVSYDDVPQIRNAYCSFSPITYPLNYSAGSKTVGTEVIFLSDSLIPPDVQGFQRAA